MLASLVKGSGTKWKSVNTKGGQVDEEAFNWQPGQKTLTSALRTRRRVRCVMMAFRPAALSEQHAGYCAGLGHFMKLFSFYFQLLLPALLHFPIVHCAAITTKRTRKRSRNNNMALCGKCATVDVTTPSFLFFFLFRRKSFHDTWNRSVNGPWEATGPTRMDTGTKTFSGFFFPRIFHFKIAPFFASFDQSAERCAIFFKIPVEAHAIRELIPSRRKSFLLGTIFIFPKNEIAPLCPLSISHRRQFMWSFIRLRTKFGRKEK